jgi:hypothetical protein
VIVCGSGTLKYRIKPNTAWLYNQPLLIIHFLLSFVYTNFIMWASLIIITTSHIKCFVHNQNFIQNR